MNCQLYGSNNEKNYGLDNLDNLSHEQSSVKNINDEEQLQYYTNQNLVENEEEEEFDKDDDEFEKQNGNTLEEFHQNGGLSDRLEKEEVLSPSYNSQQADLVDGVGESLEDEDQLPILTKSSGRIFQDVSMIVNPLTLSKLRRKYKS